MLPHSCGPAGATVCASAADVVAFARLHLDGGRAPDGAAVLSAESVEAMRRDQVAMPDPWTLGSAWGLGWILFDWDGRRVFGHDGGTLGQSSFLRVVPDAGVAVALLTNGGNAGDLYRELFGEVLAEMCDLRMPTGLAPPAEPVAYDADRYLGTYQRLGVRIEVVARDEDLTARVEITGELAELLDSPVTELPMVAVAEDVFVCRRDGVHGWTPMVFYDLPDGSRYMHMGARATPKVSADVRERP
jgi:Beta-lactamase